MLKLNFSLTDQNFFLHMIFKYYDTQEKETIFFHFISDMYEMDD